MTFMKPSLTLLILFLKEKLKSTKLRASNANMLPVKEDKLFHSLASYILSFSHVYFPMIDHHSKNLSNSNILL
jgi:hypothetical protein